MFNTSIVSIVITFPIVVNQILIYLLSYLNLLNNATFNKNFQNEILKTDFEQSIKSKIKIVGMFSFLTAAQLSAFGIYLLATTSLGVITKTLGFSLPFLFYSSLSSVIAVSYTHLTLPTKA